MVGGKRREIGLGPFPAVSLKDAHTKAQARVRTLVIAAGVDPVLARQETASRLRAAGVLELTFEVAAKRFIEAKAPEWRNPKHGDQWRNTLATYAYPLIGSLMVRHITRDHITEVLEPIWTNKTETASRLRGRLEAILDGHA